jgi:hypothetical protein
VPLDERWRTTLGMIGNEAEGDAALPVRDGGAEAGMAVTVDAGALADADDGSAPDDATSGVATGESAPIFESGTTAS